MPTSNVAPKVDSSPYIVVSNPSVLKNELVPVVVVVVSVGATVVGAVAVSVVVVVVVGAVVSDVVSVVVSIVAVVVAGVVGTTVSAVSVVTFGFPGVEGRANALCITKYRSDPMIRNGNMTRNVILI